MCELCFHHSSFILHPSFVTIHSIQQQAKNMAQPRILILGGGFGGVFTALDVSGAGEVTIISDEDHFLFTPVLYEYLSGEVEEWHIAPKYSERSEERRVGKECRS